MLAILSGILIGTSYIPFPPWAIFFGFVPLWVSWLKAERWQTVWWQGWVTQFVLTLIGFNWVAGTVQEFGHLPWPFAVLCLFGFCCFANLHIPIAGLFWFWIVRKFKLNGLRKRWLLPAAVALAETFFPMIFDWNFGYTWLYAGFPGVQLAEVVGIKGLSHLSIFANLFFLAAFEGRHQSAAENVTPSASGRSILRVRILPVCLFIVLFATFNLLGALWFKSLPHEDAKLRVAIIQANIGNLEKQYAESGLAFRESIVQRYTDLTRQTLSQQPTVDFVIWPETAFPDVLFPGTPSSVYALPLVSLVRDLQTSLITGGYGRNSNGQMTNSLFVFGSDGTIVQPSYAKTILLAFGEYFPGGDLFPVFYKWFPEVAHWGRGPGPTVITHNQTKIGAQICYEGLFDGFSKGLADGGAQLIANITNDSWYGTRMQPYQHLYMTLARALEVRRPVIRSTNTGISTVISPRGLIQELSPLWQPWGHIYDLPFYRDPWATIFQKFGFFLEPLMLFAWALWVVIGARSRKV